MVYLWIGARAIQGRDAFEAVLGDWQNGPYALVTEVLLFWVPLVFHAAVGLKLLTSARPSLRKAPYAGQWMYVAQRASALVALASVDFRLDIRELRIDGGRSAAHTIDSIHDTPQVEILFLILAPVYAGSIDR